MAGERSSRNGFSGGLEEFRYSPQVAALVTEERSAISDSVPEDAVSLPEETGPAALSPGTQIGQYEIGRCLGIGSMGAVYEGVHIADGKTVAIKLLAADLSERPTARRRFLNEAKLTARISHPHIVRIIDSGEESGRVYLVMNLLEGEDLAHRLQRPDPMSIGEVIDVVGPICDALASAHRAGVTHRDLKPSNIFLSVREGGLHPMLLDFGVATDEDGRAEEDAPGGPTWNGVGTPMYLAPELVADHRMAAPASDQYALGAILYEMLTGEPPYAADDLPRLLRAIAAGNPPSARARRPELPPKLDAVVLRAMCAEPQGRFSSVEALAEALRPFAALPGAPEAGRRRPASSPAIAAQAATPSPFVRTLVPEQEAKSDPWFVAPDADEIPEHEGASLESEGLWGDPASAESEGPWVPDEEPSLDDESPRLDDRSPGVETAASRAEQDGGSGVAAGSEKGPQESPPTPRPRVLAATDWQAITGFATKHRRILVSSGIAVLGVMILFAIRSGRTASSPVPVPPAPVPVTVERPAPAAAQNTEAAPAPPGALEQTEPAPVAATPAPVEQTAAAPPPSSAAVEEGNVAPARPRAAPAPVEKREAAPTRLLPAATVSTRTDASRPRSKAAAQRERPTPVREEPTPPVVSPAPAPAPRAPERATVRMHNGVPLLD
jgi:eukaryotic-like serine/threonine-protein kinase